jgi:hypothetical protein
LNVMVFAPTEALACWIAARSVHCPGVEVWQMPSPVLASAPSPV